MNDTARIVVACRLAAQDVRSAMARLVEVGRKPIDEKVRSRIVAVHELLDGDSARLWNLIDDLDPPHNMRPIR